MKQEAKKVIVSPQMIEDAYNCLKLMGIPVFKAEAEAEAECSNMLKLNLVDAVASEDLTCLAFGCNSLIKGVRQRQEKIVHIDREKVLSGLKMS